MDPLNNILYQYYQRNLSYFPVKPTATEGLDQKQEIVKLYELSGVNVDLSALSRQVNSFAKTLDGNDQAKEGLRSFVVEFGKNPNRDTLVGTFSSLRDLQQKDSQAFTDTFASAGKLKEIGAPVTPFLQAAGDLFSQEPEALSGFLQQSTKILDAEGSFAAKRETMGSFLAGVNNALDLGEVPERESQLEDLFSGLDVSITLDEKNDFLRTNGIK
jgi:hypothetical protein